jgi:hypothetical protein
MQFFVVVHTHDWLLLLLLPPLLQDNPSLYALWPNGTCARLGLAGAANTSLTTMLEAMVNASNPAAVAATINSRLAGLMSGSASNGSMGAALTDRVSGWAGPVFSEWV